MRAVEDLRRDLGTHVKENVGAHEQIKVSLETFNKDFEEHDKKETHVRGVLFGNGQPGHDERIRNMERFNDNARRIIWILVPAVMLGALSLAWSAIMYYIQNSGK
jgi:asparagine N-glycosylation enzyme membrane subunit Stt3